MVKVTLSYAYHSHNPIPSPPSQHPILHSSFPTPPKIDSSHRPRKQGKHRFSSKSRPKMAISRTTTIWALIILSILTITVTGKSPAKSLAPSPAPAVATDCMTLIYNMSDCLTYVEKGSNSTKPDKGCCPELAGMLDTQPICLCKLLGKKKDFPVELDLNRALKLPSVCGLQTPSLSSCSSMYMCFLLISLNPLNFFQVKSF